MSSRHSPNLTRPHLNPLDPDVRERQRTMDADMAIQLSRVRSATITQRVPPIMVQGRPDELTSTYNRYSLPSGPEFPFLEPERLEDGNQLDYGEGTRRESGENQSRIDLLSPPVHLRHEEHDHPHMVSQTPAHHDLDMGPSGLGLVPSMGELPMYRPMAMQHTRPKWDFSIMEDFGKTEKIRLGLPTPQPSLPVPMTLAHQQAEGDAINADPTIIAPTGFTLPPRRPRERKLSSSNAGNTRRGKMALFEQAINDSSGKPPMSTHITMPGIPEGVIPPSSESIPAFAGGHDRSYRFSFYSNALSQTIHSRSFCELPAEGQSFEELFTGLQPHTQSDCTSPGTNGDGSSNGAPADLTNRIGLEDHTKKENGDSESETATWWLDVVSPTDEEMKMLSQVFSLVPSSNKLAES
jgi:magnesium transporter